jgi:hypothetical protein
LDAATIYEVLLFYCLEEEMPAGTIVDLCRATLFLAGEWWLPRLQLKQAVKSCGVRLKPPTVKGAIKSRGNQKKSSQAGHKASIASKINHQSSRWSPSL